MIYFDNSATTLPNQDVVDSFTKVSMKYFGNPSSLHGIGATAEQLLGQARKQVAQLLDVKEQEVYFTSGGTEGNNLAIKGVALRFGKRGKHLIVSAIEHPSVKEACEQLISNGYEVTYIPVDAEGRVSVGAVLGAIRKETILVSIMHVNNETGAIQPVEDIGKRLKEYSKVLFHVDYVQGIGKVPLNLKDSGIDLCTISGHKFHGLKGTGALYVREGVELAPLFSGGGQEGRLRNGTENVAGAVSLAKALRLTLERTYTEKQQMKRIQEFLRSELEKMDGVVVNTPSRHCAPHILNFSVPGIKSEVLVHALEEHDIYVSTTSACSSKKRAVSEVILAMTHDETLASSSIRMSLSYENDINEAKKVIVSLKSVLEKLEEVMR